MSAFQQRGVLLLQQGRYELADREFRQDLAQDPDSPLSHAYLALCLVRAGRKDDALREAEEAIRCAPGLAFSHYVRGAVLQDRRRLPEAEAEALEAIRLDPEDADYRALLASIAIGRRDWHRALEVADSGLALDAEHAACLNLRAMALVQLGRKDEAAATLGEALADDPENADTHANQGWALLHRGEHARALEHFREALRIEPGSEWARLGIVEALKARYLVYRLMLRFFLWIGRQSSIAQWGLILGFVFGRQILAGLAKSNPALAPIITPIIVLSFAFLMMTWIASPLFNLALRFNKFGRLALSREQTTESNWIGGSVLLALLSGLAYLATGRLAPFFAIMYFGFLLFPLAITFRMPAGRPRLLAVLYTAAVAVLGATSIAWLTTVPMLRVRDAATPLALWQYFTWGAVLSSWLGTFAAQGLRGR